MATPTRGIAGVFERAYVINLASATERWDAVSRQFAAIGVAPTRIDAVNGRAMSAAHRRAVATPWCAATCAPAVIACGASHVAAWRAVVADGVGAALIAEDDVRFDADFRRGVAAMAAELPPHWDFVFLGCIGCDPSPSPLAVATHAVAGPRRPPRHLSERLWLPPLTLALHGYLVSAAGAAKLLAALGGGQLDGHVDRAVNRIITDGGLAAYAARPQLAFQTGSLAVSSIADAKTPRWPNALLDRVRIDDTITAGYALNVPLAALPLNRAAAFYPVNAWTAMFAAAGAALGAAGAPAVVGLAVLALLLALDLLPLLRGDGATAVACAASTVLMAAGWMAGALVRGGVRAAVGASRASAARYHTRASASASASAGMYGSVPPPSGSPLVAPW